MGELSNTIQQRLTDAYEALRTARADGDMYSADTRQAEIEDLHRIAANHDLGIEPPRCD